MAGKPAQARRFSGRRLLVAAVTMVCVTGCGQSAGTARSSAPAPSSSPEVSAVGVPSSGEPSTGAAPACGQPFTWKPTHVAALSGRFPPGAGVAEALVSGVVELTGGPGGARGVVAPQADAFLVRDGVVVTLPVPQDLAGRPVQLRPGQTQQLPAQVALTPCDPSRTTLEPGTYQLFAEVLLNHDDGSSSRVVGGPWPIELR